MIQTLLEKIKRFDDPVYLRYLELLKSDNKKKFYPTYFIVENANDNGKNVKVTYPQYVNIDKALESCKTAKERVHLDYLKLLIRKKKWKDILIVKSLPQVKELELGRHFYIDKLPQIEETIEKVTFIKVDKKKKQQQKIKETVIERILNDYPFNLFKFKTLQECESRETSKPYYISKKDLLDIIDKNNNIKQLFPKGYKAFKKEQICKIIVNNQEKMT